MAECLRPRYLPAGPRDFAWHAREGKRCKLRQRSRKIPRHLRYARRRELEFANLAASVNGSSRVPSVCSFYLFDESGFLSLTRHRPCHRRARELLFISWQEKELPRSLISEKLLPFLIDRWSPVTHESGLSIAR